MGVTAPAFGQDRVRADRRGVSLDVSSVLFGIVVCIGAVVGVWLLAGLGDQTLSLAISDVAPPTLVLGAAMLVFRAARQAEPGRGRSAWMLIGTATVVFAVGDILFAWYQLVLNIDPFATPADAAYIAYYPIVVAALLAFPTVGIDRAERRRLAVDAAIVVVGGGMLIWQSVLRSTLESVDGDVLATFLSIGYPVGDLVLLFGVASIALRRPAGVRSRALVALVAGICLVLLADIGYALSGLDSVGWPDTLYVASPVAIAAAGYFQTRPADDVRHTQEATVPRPLLYLPYVALLAGYGTLLAATLEGSQDIVALVAGAILLTVLVLARQELVLGENSTLLSQRARRESEARFRSLAGNASDAIALVDREGIVLDATDAVGSVLGREASSLIGRSVVALAHADDGLALKALIDDSIARRPTRERLEWRIWDGQGMWRQVETIAANLMDDPAIGGIVLTTRDVGERKIFEQRLRQVTLHDVLTGLPNRALFLDRVDHALAARRPARGATTILVANIDGFKRLNDSIGHPAGDRVLQEFASRMAGSVRAGDTLARIGGDEFGLLLDGPSTEQAGLAAAERILAQLHEPFAVPSTAVQITARIGIAVSDDGTEGPTALLRDAGLAMSESRVGDRTGVGVFATDMRSELQGRFELEADLRRALTNDELILQYQPIIDLATGELVSAEALVRWNHPTRGRLAPNVFIPLAEETGLIDELGSWVLRTACSEVVTWTRIAHARVPRVAVNLSPHQVADPNLPWSIQEALARAGATPDWLSLELTEGLLLEDTSAVLERLHAIRSLGITIGIDDFGTGFSSLAYLQHFPMSYIKIDRSFVTPLDEPESGAGVVRAIIEIGRALGMSTIAEGIETPRQLDRLRALGCTYGQGYLLSRPIESGAIRELIASPRSALSLPAGSATTGVARRRTGRRRVAPLPPAPSATQPQPGMPS